MDGAARTGDIGELYVEHHAWLFGWLRKKLGCGERAADLAQDTFVRLLAARDLLRGFDEPRAYLTVVAKRLLIDQQRREALERAWLEAYVATQGEEAAVPSPEQLLLIGEALAEIDRALAGVAAKAREAFLLHYLDGVPQGEIAGRLGVSDRMVRKYLAHCLLACADARPEGA